MLGIGEVVILIIAISFLWHTVQMQIQADTICQMLTNWVSAKKWCAVTHATLLRLLGKFHKLTKWTVITDRINDDNDERFTVVPRWQTVPHINNSLHHWLVISNSSWGGGGSTIIKIIIIRNNNQNSICTRKKLSNLVLVSLLKTWQILTKVRIESELFLFINKN